MCTRVSSRPFLLFSGSTKIALLYVSTITVRYSCCICFPLIYDWSTCQVPCLDCLEPRWLVWVATGCAHPYPFHSLVCWWSPAALSVFFTALPHFFCPHKLAFFLSRPPLIWKFTNANFERSLFDTHLDLLKNTMTFFRLHVFNLEILKIEDIPGMSLNSIMPFHNDVSKLVHWYSHHQQNRPEIGLAE